jgi:hypothetical protein
MRRGVWSRLRRVHAEVPEPAQPASVPGRLPAGDDLRAIVLVQRVWRGTGVASLTRELCMRLTPLVALLVAALPSPAHAQQASPVPAADGTLHVHVAEPEPLTLEMRVAEDSPWLVLCKTPCDARLSTHAEYRVGGPGYVPSSAFQLTSEEGPSVNFEVRPFSRDRRRVAIGLTLLGPAAMVTGAVMISQSGEHPTLAEVGIPTAFVGLLGLLGGLVTLPEKTVVKVRPLDLPATTADLGLRWPMRREAPAVEGAYPRMVSVPIFVGRLE